MANAGTAVGQIDEISASMTAMDGPKAFASVRQPVHAGQALVVPRDGDLPNRGLILTGVPDMATGEAVCTPTSCTFTGYGVPGAQMTEHLDGTITRSGNTITFDLSYNRETKDGKLVWTIAGSVTATATSIDGALHAHGEMEQNGTFFSGALTWDVEVDYNAITLDPQGCPTGGFVHVVSQYDDKPMSAAATSFEAQGTAKFGPTCAAVH